MPRLRYLKNRNPNEQPSFVSSNYDDDEDEQDQENYSRQPKGWWSTESVVASLSEDKIRQTIENYRQAISILQNELISRRLSIGKRTIQIEGLSSHEERRTYVRRVQKITDRGRILRVLKSSKMVQSVKEEVKRQWLEILDTYNKGARNE